MRQYQTRVRKMRPARTDRERDNEVRQTYFDPALRAARAHAGQTSDRSETRNPDQENRS